MKELLQKKKSRRWIKSTAVCAACLLFLLAGLNGWAAKTGNVRVDSVNVRAEASAESNRVCKLPANTTVNIVEEKTGNDGKVWYQTTFLLDGAEKTGWIRSDMLTVTEQEEPEETPAAGAYTIQEPIESYAASEALSQATLTIGEDSFTAWQVDVELTGGEELYLVSAARADGSIGWFYYDPAEETFQRDMGQFADRGESEPEGLIQALQQELTELKETTENQLSMRLYIMIGLAALCVILLILVIVFGLKYRNAAYEYYDEDEDEEDSEYEDEEDDEVEEQEEDFASFFTRKKKPEEVPEESEAEAAEAETEEAAKPVTEEMVQPEEAAEPKETSAEVVEPENEQTFATDQLPEIDLSAVLEIEEAAKKEEPAQELEDFDIEILDWEDLGL